MAAKNIRKEQFEMLVAGEKPVLVDFWAPWCGYCRRIGPAYDAVAGEQEKIEVVKINIDEEPAIAAALGISVIPTLVLFKDGKALDKVVAPESKAAISRFIRSALEQ